MRNDRRRCQLPTQQFDCVYYNITSYFQPTYTELGLRGRADKKGVMWKTGPSPSWYTPWRKRCFVLKGNFLYYFDGDTHDDPPVLGAIFVKNAIIEKTSLQFATYVLSMSPIVKRRVNWDGDEESSIFYLKFKSEEDRIEVSLRVSIASLTSEWYYEVDREMSAEC